jgi:1-acyl-sn-glycerol-3-phosphate acyltransferase
MALKSFALSVTISRLALQPFVKGVEGKERLPEDGRYLVAANHSSVLDGAVLATEWAWLGYRPLHMIAYEEPFRHWLWGWFLRSARCIPFHRGSHESRTGMMQLALGYLAMREPVGIFPEGHINRGRRLRPARPGAAILALESGAPVLPVGITGSQEVLPLGAKRPLFRRAIRLRIGARIETGEMAERYRGANPQARAELIRELLDLVMASIGTRAGLEPPKRR